MTSMPGSSRTASICATSAREISAPVASPPACAMRSAWCPPSRVSEMLPSAAVSNTAPRATSSRTRAGPSVTSTSTARGSHRPAPATRVSCRCAAGESDGSSAAAMPPCAHTVEPDARMSLVTSRTRGTRVRSSSAAVRPAMPEPTTTASASTVQPGAGAASRVARRVTERPSRGPRRTAGRSAPALTSRPGPARGRRRPPRSGCASSTSTTCGSYVRDSASDSCPYAMRMTTSPGCTRCAAAPLMQTWPEPRLARDDVRGQAGAVGHVDDVHLLAGQHVRGGEQVRVDGDRPDVVQVRLRHGGAVDLAGHHRALQRARRRRVTRPPPRVGVVDQPRRPDRSPRPAAAPRRRSRAGTSANVTGSTSAT